VLPRPEALGFDLMLPCFAAGMMTAMTKTRADLLPVGVGAGAALLLFHLFGPAPAIIGAGLAGAAAAALTHRGDT
jgi:predicted branched-subunit amino acid permease